MKPIVKISISMICTVLVVPASLAFNVKTGGKLPAAAAAPAKPQKAGAPLKQNQAASKAPAAKASAGASVGKENVTAKGSATTEKSVLDNLLAAHKATFATYDPNRSTSDINFAPWTSAVTNAITFVQSNADGNADLPKIAAALEATSKSLVAGKGAPSAKVTQAIKEKISPVLARAQATTAKQKSALNVINKLLFYIKTSAA